MHILTGEIRKAPFVKEQANGNTLYIVEMSERYKDREGQSQYTNYKFFMTASNDVRKQIYAEAFQVGKSVSITCETLQVEVREHEGKQYVTLMAGGFANLAYHQRDSAGGQQQPAQRQPSQQQRQPAQRQQQQPAPQTNFDDDIPF